TVPFQLHRRVKISIRDERVLKESRKCVAKRSRQGAGEARRISSPNASQGRRQLASQHRLRERVGGRDELQVGLTTQGHIQIDVDGPGKSADLEFSRRGGGSRRID